MSCSPAGPFLLQGRCIIDLTYSWKRNKRVFAYEDFQDAAKACKLACQELGVPIAMESDSAEPPIFTKDTIRFNGLGHDSAGTFLVKRVEAEEESSCATRGKPYAACIEACLFILRDKLGFTIQGSPEVDPAPKTEEETEDK